MEGRAAQERVRSKDDQENGRVVAGRRVFSTVTPSLASVCLDDSGAGASLGLFCRAAPGKSTSASGHEATSLGSPN